MTRSEYASEPIAATVSLPAIYRSVSIPTDQRGIRKGRDCRHSQACFVFLFWWHRRMLLARDPSCAEKHFIIFSRVGYQSLTEIFSQACPVIGTRFVIFPPRLFSLSRMKFHQKSYYSRTRCSSARARPDASHIKAGVTQLIFSPLLLSVDPSPSRDLESGDEGVWNVVGMFLECSRRRSAVLAHIFSAFPRSLG